MLNLKRKEAPDVETAWVEAPVQYLADLAPASKLAPPNGSLERYQLQEWLNFITSEVHKQFSPLFDATMWRDTVHFRPAF